MKEEAKNEAKEFENELKELSLMNEKSKQSVDFHPLGDKRGKSTKNYGLRQGYNDVESNMKSGAQKLLKERAVDQKLLEKHRKLELDYAKIQATTKINTYDELMQAFIEIEEKNFKAFKFINELCNQIETLEQQIGSLKSRWIYKG